MKRRNFVGLLAASLVATPLIPKVLIEPVKKPFELLGVTMSRWSASSGWIPIGEVKAIKGPNPFIQPFPPGLDMNTQKAAESTRIKIEDMIFTNTTL